jgi:ribosomal protein S18 acetylase RimI-like enzyme
MAACPANKERPMPDERRALPADIDRLMEIRAAVRENVLSDPGSVTRADYDHFVGRGRVWVALVGGQIAGFSASDERDGSIWALFVDPAHTSRGIGAALLDHACHDLAAAGFALARLGTDPGTAADRLYRRLGWQDKGRDDRGEVIFERTL